MNSLQYILLVNFHFDMVKNLLIPSKFLLEFKLFFDSGLTLPSLRIRFNLVCRKHKVFAKFTSN